MSEAEELCDECGDPVEMTEEDLTINEDYLCSECIQQHEDEQL